MLIVWDPPFGRSPTDYSNACQETGLVQDYFVQVHGGINGNHIGRAEVVRW